MSPSAIAILGLAALAAPSQADKGKPINILMSSDAGGQTPAPTISKSAIELFRYLEEETHVQFRLRPLPWKRALVSARNGEGILYGASRTPERESYFRFSEAIFSETIWLVKRCDSPLKFNHLADLKDKSIGVVRGASYGDEFDEAANVVFKAELDANSNEARFTKLLRKRTDALVIYSLVQKAPPLEGNLNQLFGFLAAEESGSMKTHPFCVMPRPVSSTSVHFAAVPGYNDGFMERLNAALSKARASGKLEHIFPGLLPK